MRIDTLPKCLVGINKIIDTGQQINMRIMQGHRFCMTGTPPGEAFMVFAIIAMAALHRARITRLPSVLCTDDLHHLLFCAPENALCNLNQATLLFVFAHLSIFEVCLDHPEGIPRTPATRVRHRFCITVGGLDGVCIRFPAITQEERGFTITMLFDLLDTLRCFFLVSLPMMDGVHTPTTRQHMDKGPSIAHIVAGVFVFTEPGFFLQWRTKMHQFGTGSSA